MHRLASILFCIVLLIVGTASAEKFTSALNKESTPGFEGIVERTVVAKPVGYLLDDWTATTGAPMLASPKLADLTGDNVVEILMTTYGIVNPYGEGWLYAWDGLGNPLPNYPIHLTGAAPAAPAIGDIDGDGNPEIVQGTWNYLYVFNADGSTYPGWPINLYVTQTAALADLDSNGDLEIIVPNNNAMLVYNHDGSMVSGFPVYGSNSLTSAAVGDLDGDDDLEIVSGSFVASGSPSDFVYAWHHDGTSVTGFPVTTAGSVKSPPALADLDNDGFKEVIADCWVQTGTDFLYVWDHQGNSKPGWPINIPYIRLSSPSVGDLDLDGDLEIVVGGWSTAPYGEQIHALHHDATYVTGFPVILVNDPSGNVNNTPVVGNIDDDDYPEIVVKAKNNIFALNHNGTVVSGYPVFLDDENHSGTTSPSPALGDPDGDGLVEIFAASAYNNVILIDEVAMYDESAMYWPTFRNDACNRGAHGPETTVPDVEIVLIPFSPPIIIPASGGSFDFNIALTNNVGTPLTLDGWIMVTLPNGTPYGPVLGPVNLNLPAGFTLDRDRTQDVPGNAPSGIYTYTAYAGIYPDQVWDSSAFTFMKDTADDGSSWVNTWLCNGEPFDEMISISSIPDEFAVLGNYPNPFNPTTQFTFALPEASHVSLKVYNLQGSLVATLVDGLRDAGTHDVSFDASLLSSGIYLYQLTAGADVIGGKMVLVK